jgi:Mn-dependent DtxR family transcriptional regulator
LSESKDVLRGITLKVYKFILKNDKPVGIREVQRALNLSSPTLALYHMNKLEEAGFIKKELGGYVADRIILENLIRLRKFLIPRNFFYTVFLVTSLTAHIDKRVHIFSRSCHRGSYNIGLRDDQGPF